MLPNGLGALRAGFPGFSRRQGLQRYRVRQRHHECFLRLRRTQPDSACTGRALKGKASNGMKVLLAHRVSGARTQHRVVRLFSLVARVNAQVPGIFLAFLTQARLGKCEVIPRGTFSGADAAPQYTFRFLETDCPCRHSFCEGDRWLGIA